jgi:hypothetical protein
MDLINKYLGEADFIDLTQAKKNVDNSITVIRIMEDWLNLARTLVVNGKRDDAMKVSAALKKKAVILDMLMKKIPARKITNIRARRNQMM